MQPLSLHYERCDNKGARQGEWKSQKQVSDHLRSAAARSTASAPDSTPSKQTASAANRAAAPAVYDSMSSAGRA